MKWAVHCLDAANAGDRRGAVLQDHLSYVAKSPLPIVLAGPLVTEGGKNFVGSLLIMQAERRSEVEAFVKAAPFAEAGIWDQVRIDRFEPVS